VRTLVFPELTHPQERQRQSAEQRASLRAGEILQSAEAQAQAMLEAARQKAAAVVAEAYRDGRRQGQAEACAEYRDRLLPLLGQLVEASGRLRSLEGEIQSAGAELIVGLAASLAERILGRAVAAEPALLLPLVRQALAVLADPPEARVRLHPELCAPLASLLPAEAVAAGLTLVPDASVGTAGCVVETSSAFVDARLAVQLEEARRRLLEPPC